MKIIITVLLGAIFTSNSFAYYNSEQGRWLSRDPIGETGGINQYAFVLNNPVLLYDIYGLRTYYIGGSMEHRLKYDKKRGDEKQIEIFANMVGADVFFAHNQVDNAISDIQSYLADNPEENIVLIGHSWGGQSAMDIADGLSANNACACITVITLDPVSLSGGPDKLPSNIDEWKNVHLPRSTTDAMVDVPVVGYLARVPFLLYGGVTGNGNSIATGGGQWNDQNLATMNYAADHHMDVWGMINIPLSDLWDNSVPVFTLKDYAEQVSRGKCEK